MEFFLVVADGQEINMYISGLKTKLKFLSNLSTEKSIIISIIILIVFAAPPLGLWYLVSSYVVTFWHVFAMAVLGGAYLINILPLVIISFLMIWIYS